MFWFFVPSLPFPPAFFNLCGGFNQSSAHKHPKPQERYHPWPALPFSDRWRTRRRLLKEVHDGVDRVVAAHVARRAKEGMYICINIYCIIRNCACIEGVYESMRGVWIAWWRRMHMARRRMHMARRAQEGGFRGPIYVHRIRSHFISPPPANPIGTTSTHKCTPSLRERRRRGRGAGRGLAEHAAGRVGTRPQGVHA